MMYVGIVGFEREVYNEKFYIAHEIEKNGGALLFSAFAWTSRSHARKRR